MTQTLNRVHQLYIHLQTSWPISILLKMPSQIMFLLRLLTPASTILLLLIYRFIFMQIPKLRDIVNKTKYRIPITEFQIYTKLYVISSLSGILTISLTQYETLRQSIPLGVYALLGFGYTLLYSRFIYETLNSNYFISIWKSKTLAYLALLLLLVAITLINYHDLSADYYELIPLVTITLINWIPILLFVYGIVSVKENALHYKTVSGIEKYQPTHEFLEFTGQETSLSSEILDDYKKCDFYNFAFYSLFLFIITQHSFNEDNSEMLEFQIMGLLTYAVINAYLYNWYGTCFEDFRVVDKEIANFKSSVELIFE